MTLTPTTRASLLLRLACMPPAARGILTSCPPPCNRDHTQMRRRRSKGPIECAAFFRAVPHLHGE